MPSKQVDLKIGGGRIDQFHYYERFFASTALESGSCASSVIAWSIFSRVSLVSASTSEAVKPLVGMGSRTRMLRSGQPCSQESNGIKRQDVNSIPLTLMVPLSNFLALTFRILE